MFKQRFFLFLGCFALLSSVSVSGYDASPACYKELQSSFFSYDLVAQAMSMHYIQQGQWQLIYNSVRDHAKTVPDRLKQRANSMKPNPIENPFDPEGAVKLLRDVLFEVFYEAMLSNQNLDFRTINYSAIRDMFNYIWQQRTSRIEACLNVQLQ